MEPIFGIRNLLLAVLTLVYVVKCDNGAQNDTESRQSDLSRQGRGIVQYMGLISCAMKYDVNCFVNAAEDYLEVKRTELLAEADAQALQSTGRSSPEDKPSHLASTLTKLISELTNMFSNGLSGFFKAGKDLDDDDDGEESEEGHGNEVAATTPNDSVEETREITQKKKKKKPLKSLIRLIKLALIALIIVLKLGIILKALQTAMQFKFLLISLGGFAIQAVKAWMSLKDQHGHHQEEIVYKNPYLSGGDEYSSPGGPYGGAGEYNAARSAQQLVYSLQRPA